MYDITGWDPRTVFTWAALLMTAYVLDEELDEGHFWHLQGGSEAFFRYFGGVLHTFFSVIVVIKPGHFVILDNIIIDRAFRGGESRQPRDHHLTSLPVVWSAVSSSWFFQSEYPGLFFLLKIEMFLELALHLV